MLEIVQENPEIQKIGKIKLHLLYWNRLLELSGFVSLEASALAAFLSSLNERTMETIVLAEGSVQFTSDFNPSGCFKLNELLLINLQLPSGFLIF